MKNVPRTLVEAAASCTVDLAGLEAWRRSALGLNRVWSARRGVEAADLDRELGWLLDDATAATSGGWRDAAPDGGRVAMRADLGELEALWQRRLVDAVPLQYLVRGAPWRDGVVYVEEGACLIPRPETEQLVELVLEMERDYYDGDGDGESQQQQQGGGAWVDIGTGSGCIALALATELPSQPHVVAIDVSDDALSVAAVNCARLLPGHRAEAVALRQGDVRNQGAFLDAVGRTHVGACRGVVSNPPYIDGAEIAALQPEVTLHEPHGALDGGADGGAELLFAVANVAEHLLQRGGLLALETGAGGQAAQLVAHLEKQQQQQQCGGVWTDAHVRLDYARSERFVFARRA